jgi:hypothetical protein
MPRAIPAGGELRSKMSGSKPSIDRQGTADEMTAPYLGGCLCGAIRYRITAEPITVYACHCTDCQRRTGSALALSMLLPLAAIEVTAGEPAAYSASLPDGRVKRGRMCAGCCCRLWGEPPKRPGIAVLQAGTLDNTSWVRPAAHVCARSAQSWFVFPADVPVYPTMPEDPAELVRHWREAQGPPEHSGIAADAAASNVGPRELR